MPVYTGRCYCELIKFEVNTDNTNLSAWCHCQNCSRAHASPAYHVQYVPEEDFVITEGAQYLKSCRPPNGIPKDGDRKFCSECGTRIVNLGFQKHAMAELRKGIPDLPELGAGFFPKTLDEEIVYMKPNPEGTEPWCILEAGHAPNPLLGSAELLVPVPDGKPWMAIASAMGAVTLPEPEHAHTPEVDALVTPEKEPLWHSPSYIPTYTEATHSWTSPAEPTAETSSWPSPTHQQPLRRWQSPPTYVSSYQEEAKPTLKSPAQRFKHEAHGAGFDFRRADWATENVYTGGLAAAGDHGAKVGLLRASQAGHVVGPRYGSVLLTTRWLHAHELFRSHTGHFEPQDNQLVSEGHAKLWKQYGSQGGGNINVHSWKN